MRALYVTHPQVNMDGLVPVPLWGLSETGRRRARAFAARGVVRVGARLFSSTERKAVDLAEILAMATRTSIITDHGLGENDRSATGFLPPALFEATADRFFAEPEISVDGWEPAIDAQRRIVRAVTAALAGMPDDAVAVFCGHGAVGTLLKCFVGGRPIARSEDQRRRADPGGGNCFVFDLVAGRLDCDWTPMEDMAPGWEG